MTVQIEKSDIEVILSTPVFKGIPDSLMRKIVSADDCTERRFCKGDTVYDRFDFMHSLGIILEGSVRVTKDNADAKPMLMSTLHRGAVFGAAALFNDSEEYATRLTALESCRIAFFPQRLVRRTVLREPEIAENYIRYLSERILFLNRKIYYLTAGTAEQRLANFALENLTQDAATPLPMSMTLLAAALNTSRASLYRALDALTQSGAIEKNGKLFRISDMDALKEYTLQSKEEELQ